MNVPRKPRDKASGLDKPYVRGDAIPLPEVHESDSDTAWADFNELQAGEQMHFAATQPASIPMPLPKGDLRYAPTAPAALPRAAQDTAIGKPARKATLDEALQESRRNNRVCPKPDFWQRIYDTLPGDERGKRPSPPLTGPAWAGTPSLSKRMCFREHLDWAEAHGALDRVLALMKALPDHHWHHMGD
jgi:hypothetical protein